MAVINCPSCNKKVSDKAKTCTHCQVDLQNLDQDKLHTIKLEKRLKTANRLTNQSFIAMLMFCGGFLFLFWQNTEPNSWQYFSAMTSTIVGFVLYIITRIQIVVHKRKKS